VLFGIRFRRALSEVQFMLIFLYAFTILGVYLVVFGG